ncbi:MAG: hypothetical protein KA503_14105 [Methyloversatilis sp.]|nr:hypothetical protein [Methyloversatilis sp.]
MRIVALSGLSIIGFLLVFSVVSLTFAGQIGAAVFGSLCLVPILFAAKYVLRVNLPKPTAGEIEERQSVAREERYRRNLEGEKLKEERQIHKALEKTHKLEQKKAQEEFFNNLSVEFGSEPIPCEVAGANGYDLPVKKTLLLSTSSNSLVLSDLRDCSSVAVAFDQISAVEISGPGKETSSLGLAGGGFGFEGAAKGILIATALNLLSTRTTVSTYLRVMTKIGEVFLHTAAKEPADLRMKLSAMFVAIENAKVSKPQAPETTLLDLERLADMYQNGLLSASEFKVAKLKLLSHKGHGS